MSLLDRAGLEAAASLVHRRLLPTPQIIWPQLCERLGATAWVKHENHLPTGSFKVRGGVTFADWLRRAHPGVRGLVTATRGNHGQSQAWAAAGAGLQVKIVVPLGNSVGKNAAMRAMGAELVEFGHDFDEARAYAGRLADEERLFLVPAFHPELVRGVATYALELFEAASDLEVVYVPIGTGTGIAGILSARAALGLRVKVVGVVSTQAPAVKLSLEKDALVETPSAATFADGLAVRAPLEEALAAMRNGIERVVAVTDDEVAAAMRLYFHGTHNLAEGAGAAALAAACKESPRLRGKHVAVILSGANVDADCLRCVLDGGTPSPRRR